MDRDDLGPRRGISLETREITRNVCELTSIEILSEIKTISITKMEDLFPPRTEEYRSMEGEKIGVNTVENCENSFSTEDEYNAEREREKERKWRVIVTRRVENASHGG